MITIATIAVLALTIWTVATALTLRRDRRHHEAQQVAAQYEAAMAPSRQRHPSGRAA